MAKAPKEPKPVDLSEYSEERVPFDAVIRKLGHVAPLPEPKKPAKTARKRK